MLRFTPNPSPGRMHREDRAEELIRKYLRETGQEPDGKTLISTRIIAEHFGGRVSREERNWVVYFLRSAAMKSADSTGTRGMRNGKLLIRRAHRLGVGEPAVYTLSSYVPRRGVSV